MSNTVLLQVQQWMGSLVFQQYFSYIMATSFSGGRSWSTRREPSTMGKQLVNFITCGWERIHAVLVISDRFV
jgi:hypothetical protein